MLVLACCIVVLLYCCIVVLLYCCIVILFYCFIALLLYILIYCFCQPAWLFFGLPYCDKASLSLQAFVVHRSDDHVLVHFVGWETRTRAQHCRRKHYLTLLSYPPKAMMRKFPSPMLTCAFAPFATRRLLDLKATSSFITSWAYTGLTP